MNNCNRSLNVANRDVPIDSIEEVSFSATNYIGKIYFKIPNSGIHLDIIISHSVTFPTMTVSGRSSFDFLWEAAIVANCSQCAY